MNVNLICANNTLFNIAKYFPNCRIPTMIDKLNTKDILEFYLTAGVDETCGRTPFAISAVTQSSKPTRPVSTSLSISSGAAMQNAGDLCAQAQTIAELKKIVENFDGCNLKNTAANTVMGDGNPQAKIMFIGEAPGAEEDLSGRAFVGRSGQLLDKMMSAIGLDRSLVYICNILPWRPPGNRSPSDAEIAVCLPFLLRQIEIVAPKYILTLGAIAANSLLNLGDSMSKLRSHWYDYQLPSGQTAKVLATYHPAYLLRTPTQKAKSWADFLRFAKEISQNN